MLNPTAICKSCGVQIDLEYRERVIESYVCPNCSEIFNPLDPSAFISPEISSDWLKTKPNPMHIFVAKRPDTEFRKRLETNAYLKSRMFRRQRLQNVACSTPLFLGIIAIFARFEFSFAISLVFIGEIMVSQLPTEILDALSIFLGRNILPYLSIGIPYSILIFITYPWIVSDRFTKVLDNQFQIDYSKNYWVERLLSFSNEGMEVFTSLSTGKVNWECIIKVFYYNRCILLFTGSRILILIQEDSILFGDLASLRNFIEKHKLIEENPEDYLSGLYQ